MPDLLRTRLYHVVDIDTGETVGGAFCSATSYPNRVLGTKYGRYDIDHADHNARVLFGRASAYSRNNIGFFD